MLSQLIVQNFAIIDNLCVDFKKGFTVLTGETGAGKSLIIDAIGLLLGNRSSTMMIRNGETKAKVEGIFENVSSSTKKILSNLEIELLDGDVVVIKRELSVTGKNLIRVNGEIVTLNQLELIASTLGDVHAQGETHKLFTEHNYLSFIDNDEVRKLIDNYLLLKKKYLSTYNDYKKVIELSKTDKTNLEFWLYQYNELEKANLSINEENNLESELVVLNNFENIHNYLSSIKKEINDNNILNSFYEIINNLDKLKKVQTEFVTDYEHFNDYYYEIEDFVNKISNKLRNLDFDEIRLNEINERLSYLNSLKHKYNRSIIELISFKQELKEKIENFEQIDDKILELKKQLELDYNELKTLTLEITKLRKCLAKKLENNVLDTLKDLMLNKVILQIKFNDYSLDNPMNYQVFKNNGCDEVDFLISFNVGETLKPLSKVASGGEMSRVMLALKVHVLQKLELSTIIFDEIDSGVSGSVAEKVGEKLKNISKYSQVLAITHLPIVASFADNHIFIYKEFSENATSTKIKELSVNERIEMIAEMITPNDASSKSKDLAKLMLLNNK